MQIHHKHLRLCIEEDLWAFQYPIRSKIFGVTQLQNLISERLLNQIFQALSAQRYETARRIDLELLKEPTTRNAEDLLLLHDTSIALGDFHFARELLENHPEVFRAESRGYDPG